MPTYYWDYAFGIESACQALALAQRDRLPETGLASRETFDLWIANAIDWTNEAIVTAPALAAAWGEGGPALYDALVAITGAPLVRESVSATVYVCLNRNSNASPMSLSVPYFLPEAGAALGRTTFWEAALRENELTFPLPPESFVELAFHELLHVYVADRLQNRSSPLIQAYAEEGSTVQTHLHVFALEQAVYELLSQDDPSWRTPLERSQRLYRAAGATRYTRAWEIVQEVGSEPFIAELIGIENDRRCSFCSAEEWPSVGLAAHLYDLRF